MKRYVIVYWSRFGNGKKIVEYLSEKLKEKNSEVEIYKTEEANPANMADANVYLFSAPTEAFNIQRNMRRFLKKLKNMEGKKYGIINTHSMNRNWLYKMEKILSKKNMIKIAETDFIIKGKDIQDGKGLPDDWQTKTDEFILKILNT
ncbi:MAG: flavodoxin domain-containing protein [Candidatus Thermoplasmatota archaeon]